MTDHVVVDILRLSPHPNANMLEVGQVCGYQVVVRKGDFFDGDKVIFIPAGWVLPPKLLEGHSLTGKLDGPDKNIVRTVSLRGEVSSGLCLHAPRLMQVGQHVEDILGITRAEKSRVIRRRPSSEPAIPEVDPFDRLSENAQRVITALRSKPELMAEIQNYMVATFGI